MKVFHGIDEYEAFFKETGTEKPAVALTLGKFDGIHLGHGKLIDTMMEKAAEKGLKTLLFTFDQPFSLYFGGEAEVLTTNFEREEAVREWGIDYLFEYPLREDTVNIDPDEFVDKVLLKGLNAKFIAAGPDMSYGRGGEGNIESLKKASAGQCEVLMVEKVRFHDETVSSSYVRDVLKTGDMELVTALLSRPYSISGKVSHGRKLGSKVLSMPTVNIIPEKDKLLPPLGVYFSETIVGTERFKSITNIGKKPTVQSGERINAETFLYDFDDDLYGENIRVELLHFHREEKKFESMEVLKTTMHNDMLSGMEYFKENRRQTED